MTGINQMIGRGSRFRANRLAMCLSAALVSPMGAIAVSASAPVTHGPKEHADHRSAPSKDGAHPSASSTWVVKNCTDHDADSLRDIIENPMKAKSGDKIDLSQLPTLCAMVDSTITLTGGEIAVHQDTIYLYGPTKGSVTISGGGMSRVLHHDGVGLLSINSLTVSDGYYHTAGYAYGGCIESDSGNVDLNHVVVSDCRVVSDSKWGNGGGASAHVGDVTLVASSVSNSEAEGGYGGWGGGVYAQGAVFARYSSISSNTAKEGQFGSAGGGMAARSGATIIASTVDANSAADGGGMNISGPTTIINSTISGNSASYDGGGIRLLGAPITIANTTIAFNHQDASSPPAGGIYFYGASANSAFTLQSSIIANNTAGAGNVPADVYIVPGYGKLAGTANLVMASNVFDQTVITLNTDPELGPLQFNGGPTRTRQLSSGSPALDGGNDAGLPPSIASDQRGPGYPRKSGPNASVDLGAVQFDAIFVDGLESPLH